jgi:hypothetical protein
MSKQERPAELASPEDIEASLDQGSEAKVRRNLFADTGLVRALDPAMRPASEPRDSATAGKRSVAVAPSAAVPIKRALGPGHWATIVVGALSVIGVLAWLASRAATRPSSVEGSASGRAAAGSTPPIGATASAPVPSAAPLASAHAPAPSPSHAASASSTHAARPAPPPPTPETPPAPVPSTAPSVSAPRPSPGTIFRPEEEQDPR